MYQLFSFLVLKWMSEISHLVTNKCSFGLTVVAFRLTRLTYCLVSSRGTISWQDIVNKSFHIMVRRQKTFFKKSQIPGFLLRADPQKDWSLPTRPHLLKSPSFPKCHIKGQPVWALGWKQGSVGSIYLACTERWVRTPAYINPVWRHMLAILALGSRRQKEQKLMPIFSYVANLRSVWDTGDYVLKRQQQQRSKTTPQTKAVRGHYRSKPERLGI